jgi:hypothetical protein
MKTKTVIYGIRIVVALTAVVLVAIGCQSALDFDSLKAKTPGTEAGVKEGGSDVPILPDKGPLPDSGKCVSGLPCTVTGAKGECAKGKAKCFEAGPDGVCEQTVQPAKEACDGKDGDCDGVLDINDADACAGETYCKTPPTCSSGCAATADCTNGNSCDTTAHSCKCAGTGPRCSGEFQCDTATKSCRCGSKKISCGANESCNAAAGTCVCGSTTATDGPACKAPQACLGTSPNKACGIKSDAGPDKGPVDQGPDKPTIDKSVVDQPVQIDKTVIDKAVIDKMPIDKTPIDKTIVDQP